MEEAREVQMDEHYDKYLDKEDRARQKFEEENFTRIPLTKAYNKKLKDRMKHLSLRNQDRFDSFEKDQKDIRNLLAYENIIESKKSTNKEKIKKKLGVTKKIGGGGGKKNRKFPVKRKR